MQKRLIFLMILIFSLTLVSAQNKLEVNTVQEKYSGGENITLRISLYDSSNNLVNDNVLVSINSSDNKRNFELSLPSNKISEVDLGKNAPFGYWKVNARYLDKNTGEIAESNAIFFVEANDLAQLELNGDNLTVKNIGNTVYTKTLQIVIGDTIGTKTIEDLAVGESITFRLIAPDGDYNIKITDGTTTISREKVALTGEVIGVLDERLSNPSPGITGSIGNKSLFNNTFVYIFIIAVFVAGILLAVENNYRKKLGKM